MSAFRFVAFKTPNGGNEIIRTFNKHGIKLTHKTGKEKEEHVQA